MSIDDFRADFRKQLAALYEPEEVENLCFLTLEHVLKMNRVEISLSRKQNIHPSQRKELEEITARLSKSEPIQYITGSSSFYGLDFQVNPATLIPRPETEELVAWIIDDVAQGLLKEEAQDMLRLLDIGTGSGCIAITLAKNIKNSKVEAIDISQNALATAYQNAKANGVKVDFYNQNILETQALDEVYNVIVSNPPYVREQEKAMMRENVLSNEPDSALFVSDQDPLIFYRKIGELASKNLAPAGALYFEINEYLGRETVALLKNIGFTDVVLRKDMFGKDRMIKACMA